MESVLAALKQVPPLNRYIPYGTSGFRSIASEMPMVAFKAGLTALVLASEWKLVTGVMVTASHNPIRDNGIKFVDAHGEMFSEELEQLAERLVNGSTEAFNEYWAQPLCGTVLIGSDTRPSSPQLVHFLKTAVEAAGGTYHDYGLVTTPQLHYLVKRSNETGCVQPVSVYYEYFAQKLTSFMSAFGVSGNYEGNLTLDVSGGVGHIGIKDFEIPDLSIRLINTDPSQLNSGCGSDFVHTHQCLPSSGLPYEKSASFDGDADRLIYYKKKEEFHLLGGDRLTVLLATALKALSALDGVEYPVTVVTTAYTNNACIEYLCRLGVTVKLVATGMKHLHREGKRHPVSIFFEANGHGTVWVSEAFKAELVKQGCKHTLGFLELSNETIGDAIADLFMAEASLRILGWSLDDWISQYSDYPTALVGWISPFKDQIKTTPDETTVLGPDHLAEGIRRVKEERGLSKVVVRPSGTEPVVRIYVEAASKSVCDEAAERLKDLLN